jgi:hypothetical protein
MIRSLPSQINIPIEVFFFFFFYETLFITEKEGITNDQRPSQVHEHRRLIQCPKAKILPIGHHSDWR